MIDWNKYIGMKYTAEFDCFDFVTHIYRNEFTTTLPAFKYKDTDTSVLTISQQEQERSKWIRLEAPEEGCIALMSSNGREYTHLGIYTSGGVIHCQRAFGVMFDTLPNLITKGYPHAHNRYYKYVT